MEEVREPEEIDSDDVAQAIYDTMQDMAEDEDSTVRTAGNRVSMTQKEFVEGVTGMVENLAGQYEEE